MSCFLDIVITGITGDCSNTNNGEFGIIISGSAPDYTIDWSSPSFGTFPLGSGVVDYNINGLSGGTYVFKVIDSCVPPNTEIISIYISTGSCVSINSIDDTTCGLNNGSITATTTNFYGFGTFYLYEINSGYISSGTSFTNDFVFNTLSAGTYYVIADDGGGCTGKSQSCIVKNSTPMDFGFYIVNNAGCGINTGAIYITGLTGVAPYTYLWNNGNTTSSLTGLTGGSYSVTITDSQGCTLNKPVNVGIVPNVGIAAIITTNPSCFIADGTVDVFVTGGTPPYYFSGSNGSVAITFANSYTFTGVSAGIFGVKVTDAGLCNTYQATSLVTPNSFSIVSVTTTNSTCNNSSGTLNVSLFGSTFPFTLSLTDSSGNTNTIVINAYNHTFSNLESGNYTLTITDGGPCTFVDTYTISNTNLFNIYSTSTGTTCNNSDGALTIYISSGGTPPYTVELDGTSVFGVVSSAYTFTNLTSGSYSVSVIDSNFCQQTIPVVVSSSSNVDFVLSSNSPITGNTGVISALITDGEPPFVLSWSSNVPSGQTGTTITGLTAGTYSLTITDDNGCVQSRTIDIIGSVFFSSYEYFTICDSDLTNSGEIIKKGPKQMLYEGFVDLTSGDTGCILNAANWELVTIVSGITSTTAIYASFTLNDFPSDDLIVNLIKTELESYYGIDSVVYDPIENKLTIKTICNPPEYLVGTSIMVGIKITYSINCITCS